VLFERKMLNQMIIVILPGNRHFKDTSPSASSDCVEPKKSVEKGKENRHPEQDQPQAQIKLQQQHMPSSNAGCMFFLSIIILQGESKLQVQLGRCSIKPTLNKS
jgi:hypothetical protein